MHHLYTASLDMQHRRKLTEILPPPPRRAQSIGIWLRDAQRNIVAYLNSEIPEW